MLGTRLHALKFGSAVLTALICLGVADAGSLTPPPGPIQPTDRVTLNEQFITLPFTINQPGSYVLTSNLTGVASSNGIIISADDVTLDLNGFEIRGVPGSLGGVSASGSSMVLRNGTIRGWGGSGVTANTDCLLTGLRMIDNGVDGLNASGDNCLIIDCVSTGNVVTGIRVGRFGRVSGCIVENNGEDGIRTNANCLVLECIAEGNGDDGIDVSSATISRCIASGNSGDGIELSSGSYAVANTCEDNFGSGIRAGGDSNRIDSNLCLNNGIGIKTCCAGNLVVRNMARGNSLEYDMGSSNTYGTIVVMSTGGIINDSPWANFDL